MYIYFVPCRTRPLLSEFTTLAESYWAGRGAGESASQKTAEVFFAFVDYQHSRETFASVRDFVVVRAVI